MSESGDPIRVLLLDDHTAFREALGLALSLQSDIQVVASANSLADARRQMGMVLDVAVLDLDLPDGDGSDLITGISRTCSARSLILTASAGRRDLARAVYAGAAGLLHKSTPIAEIIAAIRRIHDGGALISQNELAALMREGATHVEETRRAREGAQRLTKREGEVLHLLAEGLSDKEIAHRIGVSIETTKSHVGNIYAKLGVESRVQALVAAARAGIITLD